MKALLCQGVQLNEIGWRRHKKPFTSPDGLKAHLELPRFECAARPRIALPMEKAVQAHGLGCTGDLAF